MTMVSDIPGTPFTGGSEVNRTSAEAAHSRVDQHEAVCAFRWAAIERQLIDLKNTITAQGVEMNTRFNLMSSRQWAAASTLVILLIGGMAALLLVYIQHLGGVK